MSLRWVSRPIRIFTPRSGFTASRRLRPYLSCLVLLAFVVACSGPPGPGCLPINNGMPACGASEFSRCTVVTISAGDKVFFGGNDDYHNRDSTYWVDPGYGDGYGAIYFGAKDNVQQGFNEKGLAYDANGLPRKDIVSHPGTKPVYDSYGGYIIRILRECANVEQVIAWAQEHRWHDYMHDQMHFADAGGDAVVISVGPDGKVAYTPKSPGDGFLVSTNFNVADRSNGSYPCWRYDRAETLLGQIDGEAALNAGAVASVMEAVHVENPQGWTLYSVVADLPQRLVYVYFWFQYDAPIVLSIDEQIAKAPGTAKLSTLFPPETLARAEAAEARLMARPARCDAAGLIWLALVVLSVLILLLLVKPGRSGLVVWLSVVVLLGPVGLVALLAARRGRAAGSREGAIAAPGAGQPAWPDALAETAACLPPCIVAVPLGLVCLLVAEAVLGSSLVGQLPVLLYALALVLGLALYQVPLLARNTGGGYLRALGQRLPAALVATNLMVAGLAATALPLLKWQTSTCPLSAPMLLGWWAIAVAGAIAGGVLLYAYQAWAVRQGYRAWSACLWNPGTRTASHPSWRALWFWLVLSSAILAGGLAIGTSAL